MIEKEFTIKTRVSKKGYNKGFTHGKLTFIGTNRIIKKLKIEIRSFDKEINEFNGYSESEYFPSKRMTFRGNRILAKDEVVFDPKKSKRDGVFNSKLFWILYGWPSMFWGYRY